MNRRLPNLFLLFSLLLLALGTPAHPAGAHRAPPESTACTLYVDSHAATDGTGTLANPFNRLIAHTTRAAGDVLCLRAGTYAQGVLALAGSGSASQRITLQAYPGESVTLLALGGSSAAGIAVVQGAYWTIQNLKLDNAGLGVPAVVVNTAATGAQLLNNDITHGGYNGLDIYGSSALIQGNTIHDFQPSNQVPGNDAQCVNVHGVANNGLLRGNTIFDCWGDGIQFFVLLPTLTNTVSSGWIVTGNTFYRGSLGYSENSIDVKGTLSMTISGNDIRGYTNVGHLGTNQPAVVFHGNARNVTFSSNRVHDSAKGIELTNGTWVGLVVMNNTLKTLGDYAMEFGGAQGAIFRNNTLDHITLNAIQVAASGWVGGSFDHNTILSSGTPRLFSGASWSGVVIGPNSWIGTAPGFLAGAGDVSGLLAGFGSNLDQVATATATATLVATSTDTSPPPTSTSTSTSTPTDTPTVTPTPTATPWDLGHCYLVWSGSAAQEVCTPMP